MASVDAVKATETFPSLVSDKTISSVQQQLISAKLQLEELRLFQTDLAPEVKAAIERVKSLESLIQTRVNELVKAYDRGLTPELIKMETSLLEVETRRWPGRRECFSDLPLRLKNSLKSRSRGCA